MNQQQSQPIQIQVEGVGYYLTGVNMAMSEEEFVFLVTSQNQARQYFCSPKHAKRIYLLLQKFVNEYEKKFGELKTDLPKLPDQTGKNVVGFQDK